jgi:hypothetical protein
MSRLIKASRHDEVVTRNIYSIDSRYTYTITVLDRAGEQVGLELHFFIHSWRPRASAGVAQLSLIFQLNIRWPCSIRVFYATGYVLVLPGVAMCCSLV